MHCDALSLSHTQTNIQLTFYTYTNIRFFVFGRIHLWRDWVRLITPQNTFSMQLPAARLFFTRSHYLSISITVSVSLDFVEQRTFRNLLVIGLFLRTHVLLVCALHIPFSFFYGCFWSVISFCHEPFLCWSCVCVCAFFGGCSKWLWACFWPFAFLLSMQRDKNLFCAPFYLVSPLSSSATNAPNEKMWLNN